jgi:hypothetical protein
MNYTNKLNEPTTQQLADKIVPLEQKYEGSDGNWRNTPHEPTVTEMLTFMHEHGIPLTAKVIYMECGSHTLGLTW